MALAPIAHISTTYDQYPNYWLKFYKQGTTTPIEMATDSTGATQISRAEISSGGLVPAGFIKTSGNVIFIPWVTGAYDAWLFPTAAEADSNDTANAIRLADNIDAAFFDANTADSVADMITKPLASGDKISTLGYSTSDGVGAADYLCKTLAEGRAIKGDAAWIPDEAGEAFTLSNGNVAINMSGSIIAEEFGFRMNSGHGSDQSAGFQAAINSARRSGGGAVCFGGISGEAYLNVTVPDRGIDIVSKGGVESTALYPFNPLLPAIETKADAEAVAENGFDFVTECSLKGFSVRRGEVSPDSGPLVKLWRYRESDFDIVMNGDGGIGLQIVNLFEGSFPRIPIKNFDVGIDITDGPQADSIDFSNAQIQYNKVGMIIGRTRTGDESVTPDQNAGINNLRLTGKILGRYGGAGFISSGNSSIAESVTTAAGSATTTVPVASTGGFEEGECVIIGASNDLQYGFVSSVGAGSIELDRVVTFSVSDRVFQGRVGAIVCHCRGLDLSDLQLEALDAGVFAQSASGYINISGLALSSVIKPIYINGATRRLMLDGVIGGTEGDADWKLVTIASTDNSKIGVTIDNCFLEGSGYYQFSVEPEEIADNFLDVRGASKAVAYRYSEPDLGMYLAFYGNTGKSSATVRGTSTRDNVTRYISEGRDFVREFVGSSGELEVAELFDVSQGTLKYVKTGDSAPFVSMDLGDPTASNDPSRFVQIGGGSWNNKPLRLGGYYFWVDPNGRLRIKLGAPTSSTDGSIVGTQS